VDPLAVTSLFVEPVTQLYAVTFNQQEAFQAAVDRLRRGVAWPLAAGRLVYGWPASEGLQKVRVTAVPDYVTVDQLSAHMGQFGHVLKAERGKDKLFPSAYDGVVHFNLQLLQGVTLPNFLAIREEGRTLLNVSYVFSDLHKKACFRCGQLAHLGQYCRAAVKPIVDQGPVWSFMDVPARLPPVVEDGQQGGAVLPQGDEVASTTERAEDGASGSEEQLLPPYQRVASVASSGLPAPTAQEVVEPASSARPSLGQARVVELPGSAMGPPFRVVSGPVSEEAASVDLPPSSEPFLYLSPDTQPLEAEPSLGINSQDTLPSPYLSDSVFRGEMASVSQQSVSSLASEAETVSGVESDGADSSQVGLPPGQFQVVRGKQRKRRRPEAERLAAGSPVKPADAKRMVSGRLASPVRQSLDMFRDSQSSP
jgi:hypothetical protein